MIKPFIPIFLFWLLPFLCLLIMISNSMKPHPISFLTIIIIFYTLICIYMSMWKDTFIYSIIIFIIMISGLFIIFLYFASLISNEKMNFILNFKILLFSMIMLLQIFNLIFKMNFLDLNFSNYLFNECNQFQNMNMNKFNSNSLLFFYTYPMNNLTLFSIFFLLMSFFMIIKINMTSFSISLRKIFK